MSPAGADLMALAESLARRIAQRAPTVHAHFCACGDYFVCSQSPDRCIVPTDFICVACEMDAVDEAMSR